MRLLMALLLTVGIVALQVSSTSGIVMASGGCTPPPRTATPHLYDFNHLCDGSLNGQDSWTVTSNSGGVTQAVIPSGASRNERVTGHDGSRAARQLNGGSGVGSVAVRSSNDDWSVSDFDHEGVTVFEFEMQHPYWGSQVSIGTSTGGSNFSEGLGVISSNQNANKHRLSRQGSVIGNHTSRVASFGRYQLIVDPVRDVASVAIKDLGSTPVGEWVRPSSLSSVSMGFTSDGTAGNPSNWNAIRLRSDSYDPSSLFDNLIFRTIEPSTRSLAYSGVEINRSAIRSLAISGVNLSGALTANLSGTGFTFEDGSVSRAGVADGTTLSVRFAPTVLGQASGELRIAGDDMVEPLVIALTGEGVAVRQEPEIEPSGRTNLSLACPDVVKRGQELTCVLDTIGIGNFDFLIGVSDGSLELSTFAVTTDSTGSVRFLVSAPPRGGRSEMTISLLGWNTQESVLLIPSPPMRVSSTTEEFSMEFLREPIGNFEQGSEISAVAGSRAVPVTTSVLADGGVSYVLPLSAVTVYGSATPTEVGSGPLVLGERGERLSVTGTRVFPGSPVQVFLPRLEGISAEQARFFADDSGDFSLDLAIPHDNHRVSIPTGIQHIQIVFFDPLGNRVVLNGLLNVNQPPATLRKMPGYAHHLGTPQNDLTISSSQQANGVFRGLGWEITWVRSLDNSRESKSGYAVEAVSISGLGFLPGSRVDLWDPEARQVLAQAIVTDEGLFQFAEEIAPSEDRHFQIQAIAHDGLEVLAKINGSVDGVSELSPEPDFPHWIIIPLSGLAFGLAVYLFLAWSRRVSLKKNPES